MSLEPKNFSRERLSPPSRDMSDFFFEQRLYDFTNKNLSAVLTEDMKKYMDENIEAKEKVGAMLLAFEYFNSISEIKLEYNKDEFLVSDKTWFQRIHANVRWMGFLVLVLSLFLALILNFKDIIQYFSNL